MEEKDKIYQPEDSVELNQTNKLPLWLRIICFTIFLIFCGHLLIELFPIIMICKLINTLIHRVCPNSKRWLPCPCIEGNFVDNLWYCHIWQFCCCPESCCVPGENCLCCGKPSCCCQTPYFRCTSEECCCCCCPDPSEDSIERANDRRNPQQRIINATETIPKYTNDYEENQGSQYYPNLSNETYDENLIEYQP